MPYKLPPNGIQRLQKCTLSKALAYPQKIEDAALKNSAGAIILAHNHPTGNPEPSEADKKLTFAIESACRGLDIEVVDHLILAEKESFSFRENALI